MKVEIVPATRADIEKAMIALYGQVYPIHVRMIAFVGKIGDEVLGFGGIAFMPDGIRMAFCDVGDKGRSHPVALHRAAKMTMDAAVRYRVGKLYATIRGMHPKSPRWLQKLGFIPEIIGGELVYVWNDRL